MLVYVVMYNMEEQNQFPLGKIKESLSNYVTLINVQNNLHHSECTILHS